MEEKLTLASGFHGHRHTCTNTQECTYGCAHNYKTEDFQVLRQPSVLPGGGVGGVSKVENWRAAGGQLEAPKEHRQCEDGDRGVTLVTRNPKATNSLL